jgi:RecB family exonuclease
MLEAFIEWRAQTRGALTEVGVEVEIDGTVATGDGGEVRLRGRVDRLERDAAGRLVIVDIKTGKTPASKDDAQQHAQLAMYQLAVAEGLVGNGTDDVEPGGARLVYVGKTGASGVAEREQDPLTAAAGDEWREVIGRAAGATSGPQFIARRNDGCTHCPVRPNCPAHTDGSQR